MGATILLLTRRPVKSLAIVQLILTALVILAFIAAMKMASWLHHMAFANPVRQKWEPRLHSISTVLWFGAIITWLLFTVFHLIVVARRKQLS